MATNETYYKTESGAVTNTPMPKTSKYAPLFFLRTGMLFLTWCVTGVAIGLGFWATNLATRNQNKLLSAFQPPAVVYVSVHNIYTSGIVTALGCCVLWVILTVALGVSIAHARTPHRFASFGYLIIALAVWVLISGAAETWFFARTGTQLFVAIDGVQVPQRDVDAMLIAAGVPVRYRSSISWRVTIAFVWITFFCALATASVLFAADDEAKAALRTRVASAEAGRAGPAGDAERKGSLDRSLPPRSPLRSRAGEKGAVERDNGIEEVPIEQDIGESEREADADDEAGEGDRLVRVSLDNTSAKPGDGIKPLDLGLRA